MKTKTLLYLTFFFLNIPVFAQNRIEVSETKATHLICPERVSYLLSGDQTKVIAEIVPKHPNIVRVKATAPFEVESSLAVISAGKIYSLAVVYEEFAPIDYHLKIFSSEKVGEAEGGSIPEYILKELCLQMLFKKGRLINNRKTKKDGVILRLDDIGLNNDLLFFEVSITNTTNISYKVEGFNWWINDKRQVKATNMQEYQLQPEYKYYGVTTIPAGTTLREVFVLPKLCIPGKRVLKIEVLEKALGNTGRKLSLEIKNRDILKARKLR